MRYKKVIAAVLCVSLALSGLGSVFAAMPEGKSVRIPFTDIVLNIEPPKLQTDEKVKKILGDIKPQMNEKLITNNSFKNKEGDILYEGEKIGFNNEEMSYNDVFHLEQKDIESLIAQGFNLGDIIKADQIANKDFIDPRLLLESSRRENSTLEAIAEKIKVERKAQAFEKLKEKYPNEYKKLTGSGLNENEKFTLLAYANIYEVSEIEDLAREYKKNGDKAFEKYKNLKHVKVSKEVLDKYGLSESEAKDMSDEAILQIADFAQKNNMELKEALKKYTSK